MNDTHGGVKGWVCRARWKERDESGGKGGGGGSRERAMAREPRETADLTAG